MFPGLDIYTNYLSFVANTCPSLLLLLPPQKLLDAKLRRVYQEGSAARAAGRNPLAEARDDDREDDATVDLEAEQALADAAMAALLEEVEG